MPGYRGLREGVNLVGMEMTHTVIANVVNVTYIAVIFHFIVTVHVFERAFVRTVRVVSVLRFYPLVFCASVLKPNFYLKKNKI